MGYDTLLCRDQLTVNICKVGGKGSVTTGGWEACQLETADFLYKLSLRFAEQLEVIDGGTKTVRNEHFAREPHNWQKSVLQEISLKKKKSRRKVAMFPNEHLHCK